MQPHKTSSRAVFLALAGMLLSTGSGQAGCLEDIQAAMKAREEASRYIIATEMTMAGQVIQHSEQHFLDYSNFYQAVRETGVHWLVLGNHE